MHVAARVSANPRELVMAMAEENRPPLAGTLVDHSVTHPTEYDFFLSTDAGIQGISKSAHYHVLHHDTDIPIDELEAFT